MATRAGGIDFQSLPNLCGERSPDDGSSHMSNMEVRETNVVVSADRISPDIANVGSRNVFFTTALCNG